MLEKKVTLRRAVFFRLLFVSLICAFFAMTFEPSETSNLPVLVAFSLWATHFLFAAVLFVLGIWVLQRVRCPEPGPIVISALLSLPVFALVSLFLDIGFGTVQNGSGPSSLGIDIFLNELVAVTPFVAMVVLAVVFVLLRDFTPEFEAQADETKQQDDLKQQDEVKAPLTELIASVPKALGDDIIRLHAQDHYVEVVTTDGSALLSEQFGDCVESLNSLNGIQCHRSHWVCLDHVEKFERAGSSYSCVLSNGDQVPVSRRRYAEIRDQLGFGVAGSPK